MSDTALTAESSNQLTREQLYAEVWSKPVMVLAREFGLSDVGLAKLCRRLFIPLPRRGHWAKIAAGQSIKVPALPPLPPEWGHLQPPAMVRRPRMERRAIDQADGDRTERPIIRAPASMSDESEDESRPPTLLRIVAAAKKRLSAAKTSSHPAGIRSYPGEVLDIQVTLAQLDRAISIANMLLRALEQCGATVRIDTARKRTVLKIDDVELYLSIVEQTKRTVREPPKRPVPRAGRATSGPRLPDFDAMWIRTEYDWQATGRLSIATSGSCSHTWNDTARTQLEHRIPRIVETILVGVEGVLAKRAADARREARYQAALAIYEERATRRKSESSDVRRLMRDMRAHDRAERLRAYIECTRAAMLGSGKSESDVALWASWAHAKADWIDPLVLVSDVVLDAPAPERPDRWTFMRQDC